MTRRRFDVPAVLAWGMLAATAYGQPLRPITLADGQGLPLVGRSVLSDDGSRLLVTVPAARVDATAAASDVQLAVIRVTDSALLWPGHDSRQTAAASVAGALSPDGRSVFYTSQGGQAVRLADVDTGSINTIASGASPFYRAIDLAGNGTAAWLEGLAPAARIVVQRDGSSRTAMTIPRCGADGTAFGAGFGGDLSADGTTIAFQAATVVSPGLSVPTFWWAIGDAATGQATCLEPSSAPLDRARHAPVFLDATGRWVFGTRWSFYRSNLIAMHGFLHDRQAATDIALPGAGYMETVLGVSHDARYVLRSDWAGMSRLVLLDRVTGVSSQVASHAVGAAALSGDGLSVFFQRSPTGGATSVASPLESFVADLDADGDGLLDAWESAFGLDPSTAADASLDPDNDGRTNSQEYADGTHPKGAPVRYFAEGADGAFFRTSLALFNPAQTPTMVNVRFLGPDGATASRPVPLTAQTPAYLDISTLGLPFNEFSIVVESPSQIVAERRMTWGTLPSISTHTGTGVAAPSSTWHFAEGATVAGMQTFFLLQNPGSLPALATMQYLLADGTVQQRTHTVPAQSRLTVWANHEGAPLQAAEFATTITSDQPLVAERAMYRDAEARPFAAGSVVAGIAAPATTWFLAEGATGAFFDTYLLLSNPGDMPATVDVEFIRDHDFSDINTAYPVLRRYVLPPHSRRTTWISQEDPALRETQVAVRLASSLPIIAERSMWWPGPTSASWREVHAQAGASSSGKMWAVADVQADAVPGGWDTFVLVATTQQFIATIRVGVACDDGTRVSKDRSISVNRTTLWMRYEFPEIVGKRCAMTVESLPTRVTSSPSVPRYRVPLVVEKALYYGNGFVGGDVSLATRLPDPTDTP